MEEFKKRLISLRVTPRTKLICALAAFALPLIFLAVSFFVSAEKPVDFIPIDSGSAYSKAEIYAVDGPFVQETKGERTNRNFYLAINDDGYYIVLATGAHTDLPVYGVDVDADSYTANGTTAVMGTPEPISSELAAYVLDYINYPEDTGINEENFSNYFGDYLLDTTQTPSRNASVYYVFAATAFIVGITFLLTYAGLGKKLGKKIDALNSDGTMDKVAADFEASAQPVYSKTPMAAVSDTYFVGIDTQNNVTVLPLSEVTNVYECNIINGQYSPTSYIALETADGRRVCTSPLAKGGKDARFADMISLLKSKISVGGAAL